MRASRFSALVLALAFAAAPAAAQDYEALAAGMDAAMAQARADAMRPGDEALGCEALQGEVTALMTDPAVTDHFAAMGAWAEEQQAQMSAARANMAGMAATSMVTGMISSFIPGGGYAQMLAQRAMATRQQAQAQRNVANMMEMMAGMQAIMPQLMRSQRVVELAQAQGCAFLDEAPPEG